MSSAKDEAINLLSLDGGGVRGVASLVILHEIMLKVKEVRGLDKIPKPCEFFHMIGGTSTGGLIAIMLGRLRMSTEEALYEYDQCASKVFSTQNKKWTSVTEKFRATALKEIVEDLVRRRNMGEYLEDHTLEYDSKGQCFVCVMPADQVGEPRRLRSFASVGSKDDPGVKIWEAARATTAASFFFKPMALRTGKCLTEDYIDAAIGCNNPAEYLLQEAADQIGTGRRLGCVISIGTGTREVRIGRATSLRQTPTFIKELFGTLKSTATDGEETHRRIQSKFGHYPNAYFRFNVPGVAAEVKLHHYLKMKALKAATTTYLSDSLAAAQVLAAARVLERNASEHGLTLGHIHGIDKDQVVLSTLEAQPLGHISRFFTGRGDVLKKLDTCFAKRDTGGKPRREFLLYGLGGVGKTQIALKAADDLEDRFKYVFHIDGTNTLTAKQSYSSICQEFCQAECPGTGTTDEMKDTALRWLDKLTDEWLMIYDNYAENERFRPILPRSNRGNVIYTSRSQGFLGDLPAACVCEVKPFGKEDAVDLLLKIAGRGEPESDVELQSAQEIVAAVGFLPLAIESAGAYIREGDCSSLSYLKRFRDQGIRPKLLSKPNADGTLPARPALYTALDLSYDAIVSLRRRKGRGLVGRTAECALQALNLLCFYHNEEIPVRIIERAAMERVKWGGHAVYPLSDLADCPFMDPSLLLATNFPEGTWNDFFFDLGLQLLHRLSLVKLTPGRKRVSMHVMVQAWAQDRMSEQARPRQALVARMVLIESIVISWSKFDLTWLRLLPPHMKACLAHEAVPVTHDPYQAQLDHKLGWYYKWEKQFASAIEHFENALRIRKFEKGAHAPAATTVLFQLGQVYYDMGRLNDAEFTYLEIIDRFELRVAEGREKQEERKVRREKKSEKRARRQKTGFPSRARPKGMAEDGQIKDKQDMGDESSTLDTPVKKGDEDETPYTKSAEQQFEDIMTFTSNRLREEEETLEDLEFELASAYTELANVHYDQGRFKSCRGLMRRAIGLLKRANHPDDIRVWALEDELIRRFAGGGDLDHWAQRAAALTSFPKELYDEHVGHEYAIVKPMGYAAYLVYKEESWEEAYEVYDIILGMALTYGANDRRSLYLMRQMAWCQLHRGLFEEAEELARTAVDRAKDAYGQWHPQTAECLNMLSTVLMYQTLDVLPGSEFWSITQEAYDAARFAFSEDHHLAVQLKKRLDMFRDHELMDLDQPPREEHEGVSPEDVLGGSRTETREEVIARMSAEFREVTRREFQAKLKNKRRVQRPAVAEAGPSPHASSSTQGHTQRAGDERPRIVSEGSSGRERKANWKGKEKADTTLSPIPEGESSFHGDPACIPRIFIEQAQEEGTWSDVKGKGKEKALPLNGPRTDSVLVG